MCVLSESKSIRYKTVVGQQSVRIHVDYVVDGLGSSSGSFFASKANLRICGDEGEVNMILQEKALLFVYVFVITW